MSFAAASLRMGFKELKSDGKSAQAVMKMIRSNATLMDAVKVLDAGKSGTPNKKAIKPSIATLVDFLQGMGSEDRACVTRLALGSAKLYLFSMHLLETVDLLRNPKLFAKKMSKASSGERTSEEAAAWMKHPEDARKLKEMLNKALTAEEGIQTSSPGRQREEAEKHLG